jgi:hypothetical protein
MQRGQWNLHASFCTVLQWRTFRVPITQVRLPFLVFFTHKSDAIDLFSSSVLYVRYAYAHTDDFSVRGVVYIW